MKKQKFNPEKSVKTFAYVIENDTVNRRCKCCFRVVLKQPLRRGSYQCMTCDVELQENDTYMGERHTAEEYDELCCDVRDLLLLDEPTAKDGDGA